MNCSRAAGVHAFLQIAMSSPKSCAACSRRRAGHPLDNEQPWSFIVATRDNPAEYERLLHCLVEFNQGWAQSAPVLMISVAHIVFNRNEKENRHAAHDVGLATENLVIQAVALGLFTHGMAGFDLEKTRATYAIPDAFTPMAAWAIGYPGDVEKLDPQLRERELEPRERKPLSEFVFTGGWQKTAPVMRD